MRFDFEFTPEQLRYNIPKNREIDEWYDAMVEFLPKYDIVSVTRVAGFISQCAHESLDFTRTLENLNYSAQRLNQIFPKYFIRAGRNATHYHRQPEKIANIVYANRMDNGDAESGDGWRFRGRGLIQLTGRYNYTQFGKSCNMTAEEVIPYIETKRGAIHSACWYWDSRNLNRAADAHDVGQMTRLINGGTHGINDRQMRYRRAMNSLGKTIDDTKNLRTVKLGSRGKTVAKMQEYLGITPDGVFGSTTEATLKTWQQHNGLRPDGIAGPNTLSKMFRV